jgi:sugar/nucleoside kinase (ribokinase family)
MSNIWVLGSASWDLIYKIDQIPEAGGRATARWVGRRAGGSTGNVARALGSADHQVHLLTQLGADDTGTALLHELSSWNVATNYVLRHDSCTPEAIIFIKDAERTIIVLEKECAESVPVPYSELAVADAVFVGTYADFGPELPAFLRRSPALVMTPPPPKVTSDWFAHIIVGSQAEYHECWLSSPYEELRELVGTQLQWVVVTKGELGATAYGPTGLLKILPVQAVVRDTTGAGDSFTAGLLHALLQGHELATAGRLGAYWAAAAIELPQSVPPPWAQLGLGDPSNWASVLNSNPKDEQSNRQ